MCGAHTLESNDVIKTLVTAWKRKNAWSPLSRGMPFFLLRMHYLLFLWGTSGSFCKFNSFLFFNLFIRSLQRPSTVVSPHHHHHHHDHHHVVPLARISLTLSRHFSLSFIAFARPYDGVHRSTSLMSSSLLLQQCPTCLVRLTWIAFVMGSRWPYSWWLVECCRQDLFNIARNIQASSPAV